MLLDETVRDKLHRPTFWHLVTLGHDGMPHVRPVWVDEDDGLVLVNTGRVGAKSKTPGPTRGWRYPWLSSTTLTSGSRFVVEMVGFIEDARAESQLDELAKRYLELDVYPWRKPGEKRVILQIQPTNIIHHHDTDDPDTLPVA